jgi:hypothetical protein
MTNSIREVETRIGFMLIEHEPRSLSEEEENEVMCLMREK